MTDQKNKAVVLLSGGIDSATTAAVARRDRYAVHALSFDYGQRHKVEIEAAKKVAESLGVAEHKLFKIDLTQIGGSALTDSIDVPKDRDSADHRGEIPVTYVPARNTIFLSVALGYAEAIGASTIFIGANAIDYSGYPDCRPEYIAAFQRMANLATKVGVEEGIIKIKAPLIEMTKADIVTLGSELGVDYSLTVSCYDPDGDGLACGRCDSCQLRRKGFEQAGVDDPTRYVEKLKSQEKK